jgi:hypothetical protein
MNSRTTTNIFLGLIAGLLIALVASPVSNGTTRNSKTTYDAVQFAQYEYCLSQIFAGISTQGQSNRYFDVDRFATTASQYLGVRYFGYQKIENDTNWANYQNEFQSQIDRAIKLCSYKLPK